MHRASHGATSMRALAPAMGEGMYVWTHWEENVSIQYPDLGHLGSRGSRKQQVGSVWPRLACTVLREILQNGLQVLLVCSDLAEVTLEALYLQLLLGGLFLQLPQFAMQDPL